MHRPSTGFVPQMMPYHPFNIPTKGVHPQMMNADPTNEFMYQIPMGMQGMTMGMQDSKGQNLGQDQPIE